MLQWTLSGKQIKVSYNLQYSSHLLKNTCHVAPPSPPPQMLIHVSPICNRPFPSSPGPRYQNEVKCSAFDMEMILYSYANKTRFYKNGCALGLILKWGFLELGSGLLNSNLSIGKGEKKCSRGNVKYVGWVGVTWKILRFSLLFQRNLMSIVGHFSMYIAVPYIDGEATLHSSRTSTF